MTDTDPTVVDEQRPLAPIEFRTTSDFEVHWANRTIELCAMPYDSDAAVVVHGRPCVESCAPGAFAGAERRANRVKVNRDHDLLRTVGRAVALHPSREVGLVTELRIAKTPLGDETLALADDQALEASVGFAVMPNGERWLENRSRRRLERLFLDHISMVPEGAYAPVGTIVVRQAPAGVELSQPISTPNLDEIRLWLATGDR
jgi:HK97 family phage prohead protease